MDINVHLAFFIKNELCKERIFRNSKDHAMNVSLLKTPYDLGSEGPVFLPSVCNKVYLADEP